MATSKVTNQAVNLKQKMHELAIAVAQECTKYANPTALSNNDDQNINPVVNVACLRVIKFRKQNPFGILGVIRLIRAIRKQLKALSYNNDFVNDMTIYLVRALLRTQTT